MRDAPAVPIPNAYWVRPGRLLAGQFPTLDEPSLAGFFAAGITDFLCLVTPDELGALGDYAADGQAEAAARGVAARFHRFPVPDGGVPTPATMRQILDTIDAGLAEGRSIYVHCWGGFGRTGTVVGCHLVRHGLSAEAALAEIALLRAGTPYVELPSPESEPQYALVRGWRRGA